MADAVQIGLLGCGLISQYAHLFALEKASGVHLAAICDIAEDLVRQVALRWGVERWTANPRELLEDPHIDAILVATADQYHITNALDCLAHGKHVLVEKPLGATVESCLPLIDAVRRSGKKLQVGNMKRFDPGIAFAREFVAERVGQRLSVSGWYCDSAVRAAMQNTLRLPPLKSREQKSFDPAFRSNTRSYKLATHGVHLVDTLRFLGGDIVAVQARLAEQYNNLSWHGLLEFAGGALGHFELTCATRMDWREGYSVHGEGGSVELNTFLPFYNRPSEVRAFDAAAGEYRSPIMPDSDPYERQLEAFARAIREDRPASPDVLDGIADLAVIEAIAESVKSGRRIEVAAVTQPAGRS